MKKIRKMIGKGLFCITIMPFMLLMSLIMFIFISILCFPCYIIICLCKNVFLYELKEFYVYIINLCFITPFDMIKELMGE